MDEENELNSSYQGYLNIYEMAESSEYEDSELPTTSTTDRISDADYGVYIGAGSAALFSITTPILMEYHEEIMELGDKTLEFTLETISALS